MKTLRLAWGNLAHIFTIVESNTDHLETLRQPVTGNLRRVIHSRWCRKALYDRVLCAKKNHWVWGCCGVYFAMEDQCLSLDVTFTPKKQKAVV